MTTHTDSPKRASVPSFERILAILAAAASTLLTIAVWRNVSANQLMWPLPGLYFVELPAAAVAVAVAFRRRDPSRALVAWISAGIYAAFSVLGAFSVGLLYLPIAIMLFMLAVLSTSRQDQGFLKGLLAFIIAAFAQAALMFLFINLLYAAQGGTR